MPAPTANDSENKKLNHFLILKTSNEQAIFLAIFSRNNYSLSRVCSEKVDKSCILHTMHKNLESGP